MQHAVLGVVLGWLEDWSGVLLLLLCCSYSCFSRGFTLLLRVSRQWVFLMYLHTHRKAVYSSLFLRIVVVGEI
jgi:hypothetical protein